jgi:hypothetical protein
MLAKSEGVNVCVRAPKVEWKGEEGEWRASGRSWVQLSLLSPCQPGSRHPSEKMCAANEDGCAGIPTKSLA